MVQNLPCLRAAPRIFELFFLSSEKLTAGETPGIRSLCSLPKKRRPLKRPLQCLGCRKVKLHETQRLMKKGPSCPSVKLEGALHCCESQAAQREEGGTNLSLIVGSFF